MEKEFVKDYYKFLGVERNASEETILRAFRQKSRHLHPDKVNGNEEMMKHLTHIKVTLLDPDKKEKYDDNYEPENSEETEDLAEKLHLYSGIKLSESYLKRIEIWKNESKLFEFRDNTEIIGEKWLLIRDSLSEVHNFKSAHPLPGDFTTYLNITKVELNSSLEKLFPENIWNSGALYDSLVLINKNIGKKISKANKYFNRGRYDKALIHYIRSGSNFEILRKAHHLYQEHKFDESLLYCRHLLKVNENCFNPVLLILKIAESISIDIFEPLVLAAKKYMNDLDIQRFLLEKFEEKALFFEMNCLLNINPTLRSEIQKKKPHLFDKINSGDNDNNYDVLKALVYKSDFKSTAEFILSHKCTNAINRLFTELTLGRKTDQLPPAFRAMLLLLSGSSKLFSQDYVESFNCLREALYTYPVDSTFDAIIILLQSGFHTKATIDNFVQQLRLEDLSFPTLHQYEGRLQSSPMLRTILKFEKSIQNQKLSHLEKAMLYIDLCMACAQKLILANNLCLAAYYLLKSVQDQSTDFPTVYAFRNTICDLCATVLFFVNKYLDPIGVTHFCRLTYVLMDRAHIAFSKKYKLFEGTTDSTEQRGLSSKDMIEEQHKSLFTLIINLLSKSVKVNPIIQINSTLSHDLILVNKVNQQLLEKYYNYQTENHPKHPLNYMFKYYLFEGHWKNWFDQDTFDNTRLNCMKSLMNKNNIKINKMEAILKWPVIRRDESGWINFKDSKLDLPGKSYTSVDGLTINLENGYYKIHLSSKQNEPNVICDADITEVLEKGLSHCLFSLDQADLDLDYFPFQQMRYSPKSAKNTNYLSTVFHSDYLLKMFAMETEISARSPFGYQSASTGLLNALPNELQNKLRLNSTKDCIYGRAHRFWIEAQKLYIKQEKVGKKNLILFNACEMIVKEHLLTKNSEGEYVDDNEDDDDFCDSLFNTSAEKMFAKNFTENYDEIGHYFPIFRRLRELLKLSAILTILKNNKEKMEEAKASLQIDQDGIKDILKSIREKINYPIKTNANVQENFGKFFRVKGGSTKYQFDIGEMVKRQIAEAETELFTNLTNSLIESLEIGSSSNTVEDIFDFDCVVASSLVDNSEIISSLELRICVMIWIKENDHSILLERLCTIIEQKELAKLSRFENFLKYKKVDLDQNVVNFELVSEKDDWVPAVFSQNNGRKCYGGICLFPRISESIPPTPPSAPTSYSGRNGNIWSNTPKNKENIYQIKDSSGRPTQIFTSIRPSDLKNGNIVKNILGALWEKANLVPQNHSIKGIHYTRVENQVHNYLRSNSSDPNLSVQVNINIFYKNDSKQSNFFGIDCSFIKHGNKLANVKDIPIYGKTKINSNPYRAFIPAKTEFREASKISSSNLTKTKKQLKKVSVISGETINARSETKSINTRSGNNPSGAKANTYKATSYEDNKKVKKDENFVVGRRMGHKSEGKPMLNPDGQPMRNPDGTTIIDPTSKPKAMHHFIDCGTRKKAYEAAKEAGKGNPPLLDNERGYKPHYHPTYRDGSKRKDGSHYQFSN